MGYSARRGFTNGSQRKTNVQQQQAQQQQFQQKMQEMAAALDEKQKEIEAREFSASVGGGAVSVTITGGKQVTALTIQPEAVNPEEVEMLQDLVISAVNGALQQANDALAAANAEANEMYSQLGGSMGLSLPLPGMG